MYQVIATDQCCIGRCVLQSYKRRRLLWSWTVLKGESNLRMSAWYGILFGSDARQVLVNDILVVQPRQVHGGFR